MRKLRDRRKKHFCPSCKIFFKHKKGKKRGHSKWCNNCRFVSVECITCKNTFLILRKQFIFRGAKFCNTKCYGKWRKTILPEQHPNWKGGIDHVVAYRARKAKSEGTHTLVEWEDLKKKYNYMCLCCKKYEPKIKLEEDHIIPLSKQGRNDILNIQPLCRNCNAIKSAKAINYKIP